MVALLDRLAEVDSFLPLLADGGLTIHVPGAVIRNREDFKNWYTGIVKRTRTNASKVTDVTVQTDDRGGFRTEFTVSWEATTGLDEKRSFRSRQRWLLVDQGGTTPVILNADYQEISDFKP